MPGNVRLRQSCGNKADTKNSAEECRQRPQQQSTSYSDLTSPLKAITTTLAVSKRFRKPCPTAQMFNKRNEQYLGYTIMNPRSHSVMDFNSHHRLIRNSLVCLMMVKIASTSSGEDILVNSLRQGGQQEMYSCTIRGNSIRELRKDWYKLTHHTKCITKATNPSKYRWP